MLCILACNAVQGRAKKLQDALCADSIMHAVNLHVRIIAMQCRVARRLFVAAATSSRTKCGVMIAVVCAGPTRLGQGSGSRRCSCDGVVASESKLHEARTLDWTHASR